MAPLSPFLTWSSAVLFFLTIFFTFELSNEWPKQCIIIKCYPKQLHAK